MNTREIAVEYRLSHWAGIIKDRDESGLTIKEYCERLGIHENAYYYWLRKIRKQGLRCSASSLLVGRRPIPLRETGLRRPPIEAGVAICCAFLRHAKIRRNINVNSFPFLFLLPPRGSSKAD